jgi:hypothetical protein
MMKSVKALVVTGAALYLTVVGLETVAAKPLWVKKVKEMGLPAENCLYCHTEKLPKKEHAKEQLNDRGKWLVAQKDKKQAKEVDLEWLKDYPGGKEQK